MPRVIDIQRRHMELGRIRLGEKGDKGQPTRLDTWRLTSASRALLDSAAGVYGGTVEEWSDAPDQGYYQLTTDTTELDVMVPPGDAYSQYYELWSGGGCKRRCDGVTELLTNAPCKCDADERECKITTRINVMLPRIAGLGVWRLESHGYYAAAELPDMLELLQQVSGGRLVSGVLRIEQRSSKHDGQTRRFPVPVLDLPNITLASLTGGQVVVNAPRLEAGKPALADGATALPGDATFDNGTPSFGERPALPREPTKGELLDRLMVAAKERGMNFAQVDAVARDLGIKRGEASVEELGQLLAAIETPASGVPTAPASGGDGSDLPAADTPQSGEPVPDAATVPSEGDPPLSAAPAPNDLMDDILAVTNGELVPPKPGTKEYAALPSGVERAAAKAYYEKHPEPDEPSLAEQMGAKLA